KRINAGLLRSAKSVWQNNVSTEPRASIIVCLYGKPEFMFLQSSSFFRSFSASEYEFIYVCNSPELLETLVKTAAACEVVYDMRLTVVGLSGNVGFGGANNAASRYANSGRLLFLNPDVFPCEPSWLQKHETVLRGLPEEQTRLFGSRLFYADGSLMHAGMYFEMEPGISLNQNELRSRELVRVEHYGKGAPPTARRFCGSARVPAVSGAFISMDRGLFERLNGFSDEVIYGHYEDADLCLRAMKTGAAAWVHDVPMWHLEGKGSTRLPHHDGASLVNRWSFAQRWGTLLRSGWLGPEPAAFALEANANRQLGAGAGMRPLATAAE
ncbi:MAG: glycosyltransferase family 2 protein, partial [Alphaproteobacteria bacterium]|nr:glycosyltransferase family 2 protein [Alphaproteobacteria bacterium]